jgi:hypothetical protein
LEQANAAALDKELSAIEFRILRYRNGRGAFSALTKDLDGYIRRIGDDAACKVELRSKWYDLEEINLASRGGSLPASSEHRRLSEMVLDEMIQICQANR